MAKTGKQYIFLTAFIFLILVILYIFLKNNGIIFKEPVSSPDLVKPSYLRQPIPEVDKLKTIVNNPKFKELKYIKSFFEPVESAVSGRANPFMPFAEVEK